jgi:hypothetical protein
MKLPDLTKLSDGSLQLLIQHLRRLLDLALKESRKRVYENK